jgi:hypothetical protein
MAGVIGRSGRKKKRDIYEIQQLLEKSWPNARRVKSVKKLAKLAEDGDVKAAQTLLAYAYGKPRLMIEVTGSAGGPIQVADATDELKRRLSRLAAARGEGTDSGESE